MLDYLIRNAYIIDGTGKPAFNGDVGIESGKITAVGNLGDAAAAQVIDAAGKWVTPGFIDIHRHADGAVFRNGFGEAELCQGLTAIVNGNCGLSVAPFGSDHKQEILHYLDPITGVLPKDVPTASMRDYLNAIPQTPLSIGMLVGSGILRADACGYQTLHPDSSDFSNIHRALESALSEGALGVSLGLGYAPECFYTTAELVRALEPLRNGTIPFTVHMRQEGSGVTDSIAEMLTVAESLNCPVHISHLKAMGRENWGKKIPEALTLLHRASENGLKVDCDVYPYTAGSTQLLHILPPEFLTGGTDAITARLMNPAARKVLSERIADGNGFDNIAALAGWDGIYLTSLYREENCCYLGKNLAEIGEMRRQTPLDACCDLLAAERCMITMIDFMASEDDIISILKDPLSNVISDATYPTEGNPHPRVYGTFTRILERFVLEKKALTPEEAVHKMTAVPARVLSLQGKGLLIPGFDADLCMFDPFALHENATYEDPRRVSTGMELVLVNGEAALINGQLTGRNPGRVLRSI